ncbi:DUF1127 domain-containing protein [Prosthecomicrobium hirschii]|uniref:DUF1127 domain-containing protein n=2 Tax=Ancalomicrobiaceae TaxID=2172021 RepID=A0A947GEP7_9HYPH|nr:MULTISPECIES: DUF1127 domain-containing protein [Hyphomicrobiales]MBT9291726.1 DUF1127 domain-containing protein [Prosthecodimorpha staleyi]MCW1841662.1 DUF1127 domain-containing protein [Prosthecomicrobium hirschii]TPQ51671.1 DUF1127 domain-containing protein [Prosthecomicrobium hirschii]
MLKRFADSWSRYRKYRATVWELGGLNDRELADLGIPRADIPRLAREAVR